MTALEKNGPPFTVDRYGSLGECVTAERDWLAKENEQLHLDLAQHAGNASEVIRLTDVLRDIAVGARMMAESPVSPPSLKRYAEEVKRVVEGNL